jgi:tape measure domain-containing protein
MATEIYRLTSLFDADTNPFERAMREIPGIADKAFNRIVAADTRQAAVREKIQKNFSNLSIREQKRLTAETIRELDKRQQAFEKSLKTTASTSAFRGGFLGGAIGGLLPSAAQIVGNIPQQVSELFNKSLNFSQSVMALSAITGGMDLAVAKIKELEQVAADTPGLSFLSAVEGQKRLEAVGFEAGTATALLKNLSKVRVLSGGTKQDFDAIILNLTQIRAMGKLTGDELRETLARLPYMARVINDAFGTIDTQKIKDMNLNSDEFFTKLLASMEKVPTVAGGAALALENTSDASERLQIALGRILEQNPEVIAMFRVIQDRLNQTTRALSDNESAQRKNFSSLTSELARGVISWDGYAKMVSGFLTDLQVDTARLGGITRDSFILAGRAIEYFANDIVGGAIDWLTEKLDSLVKKLQSLPFAAKAVAGMSGIDLVPDLRTNARDTSRDWYGQMMEANRTLQQNTALKNNTDKWRNYNQARQDRAAELAQFSIYAGQERREMEKRNNTRYSQMKWNQGGASSDSDKGAGKLSAAGLTGFVSDRHMAQYQKALRNLSPALRSQIVSFAERYGIPESLALAQIFSESSFNASAKSPFNKNVGQHAFGLTQVLPSTATGVLGRKTSGTELFNTETALTAWGKYMTKLFNEFGDWELAAFAYHNGEGAARRFAAALDSDNSNKIKAFAKANPKGVAYARKIGGLAKLSDGDKFGVIDLDKQSKTATEKWKEEQTANIAKIFASIGLVSEEVVKATVDERNKALEKIGKARTVTEEAVRAEFLQNAQLVGNDLEKFTDAIMSGIGTLPQDMQETAKQFLAVAHANKVFGDSAYPLPRTMDALKSAFQQLTGATRERVVRDTGTRPRRADDAWQLDPANEWGLEFQGDRSVQRTRDDRGRIRDFNDLNQSLSDQLELLQRGSRPLTEYELTQRDIIRNYQHLDEAQKQDLLNTAAQIDTQNRLNQILGEQKTFDDILIEAQAGLVQDGYNAMNAGIEAFITKIGLADTAVGNFFQTMLAGLARLAMQEVFKMLFGGQQGSGGGWLSKLLGIGIGAVAGGLGGGLANGSNSGSVGFMAHRAMGGAVTGGVPYMTGETGREIFVPATSGYVMNNRDTERLLGSKGGRPDIKIYQSFEPHHETGAFSKRSAQQAAADAAAALETAMRRR